MIWGATAARAAAQALPSEPVTFGGGRVVLGGDVSASLAAQDLGFFNYSDYEHSTLRQLRIGMTGQVRASERLSFLGELRSDNLEHLSAFALYARVRPFPTRRFDVQLGRIPPTFGRFPRQAYSRDNPLIGYPMAYQYLTSLRSDAVPANADELFRMRGRGWLSSFSVGNTAPARGVPLVNTFKWDTGVQVTTGWRVVAVTVGLTSGSASSPRVSDDNGGKQIATRVAVTPAPGLTVGSSFARGQFLSRSVLRQVGDADDDRYTQDAHGLDVELSHGHWQVRADAVFSRWHLPIATSGRDITAVDALALGLEGRYTLLPGLYAAARAEHLTFSRIAGAAQRATWEAPVSRIEVGGGYYLQRNVIARVSVQSNWRDGGRITRQHFLAGQLLFWF